MNVRYRVELSQAERAALAALLSGGKQPVRRLKRAQILLAADGGASDQAIVTSVAVSGSTVSRTKRRFVLGNLEAALSEEPRPGAERKPPPSIRSCRPRRHAASCADWSSITPQSTPPGSTWSRSRSASYEASASTAASTAAINWSQRSMPGGTNEI